MTLALSFDTIDSVKRIFKSQKMILEIKAEVRKILGRKNNRLRRAGIIPAVLYGHGKAAVNLSVNGRDFLNIFKKAGEASLVELVLNGQKTNVLIRDLARDPLSGEIIHIDFFAVRMDEKIKAKVSLIFVGESPAIKNDGGVLVRALQEVEIEALPKDLLKEIAVDISFLQTFEDKILVKDIIVGGSVKILADAEAVVVLVAPPRSDEEMAGLEGKTEIAPEEVKVAGEAKKTEDIPAEE